MRLVESRRALGPSPLLESESYVLSDPDDPSIPNVSDVFRVILRNREYALESFFAPVACTPQDLWARFTAEAVATALRRRGVQLDGAEELLGYVTRHPDVAYALLAVARKARRQLSALDAIVLVLYRDPEIRDSYPTFILRFNRYSEQTLTLIEDVGREAERALVGTSGWILVTTDFREPGTV
jgi:hypothetical protein